MLITRYTFYLGHYSLVTRTAQSLLAQSHPHLCLLMLGSGNQVCSLPPGVIQPSFWKNSLGAGGGLGKEQSLKSTCSHLNSESCWIVLLDHRYYSTACFRWLTSKPLMTPNSSPTDEAALANPLDTAAVIRLRCNVFPVGITTRRHLGCSLRCGMRKAGYIPWLCSCQAGLAM